MSELVLEDVAQSREMEATFLRECYCQSGALSQYSVVSKVILQARYAALFDSESPGPTVVPAVDKDGVTSELLAHSLSQRPILIIGDVGVGKTTFIRHLYKVDAAELLNDAIVLYIDLGSQATLTGDIHEFVLDEISRQLYSEYEIDIEERNFIRAVYHGDLRKFNQGIYSDLKESNLNLYREKEIEFLEKKVSNKEQHLKKSIEHLVKGRRKQVVIFIDNADQREYNTQQASFLISEELSKNWLATVFVTLRPETFHRSIKSGVLSGYHPKAFTISPPRIDHVLEKRLSFALKITSGQIPLNLLPKIGLRIENLDAIIRVFLSSLQTNIELIKLIDNICGGNVRIALDLVKSFFGSGHVDTQKIINLYREQGWYQIPLHEFLRAVIYGDSEYYDPSRSPIANLYDLSHYDPKEHFLLPIILGLLSTLTNPVMEEGFIETSQLYEYVQGFGFTPEQIDTALIRASNHKLIETTARKHPSADYHMPPAIRVTTIGGYTVFNLSWIFAYFDAIIIDTPVLDHPIRNSIENVWSIESRLDRAEIMIKYFDEQWAIFGDKKSAFYWPDISSNLQKEIKHIRARVA